ncbi:LysR family transcriptional regulator [Cryobacterium sp. Y82]|uniref:LysR family transcriptional regulator n=1 Tax=Cryobacterium sp. Y82 TaxID=2045017 RepID=UPI001E60A10F|nr:LysR family transcriptional regulator [Cryobacterium sp. Y82]
MRRPLNTTIRRKKQRKKRLERKPFFPLAQYAEAMPEVSAIDDLEFFVTIARSPSLTAAAREWGVSLSAVSKRLTRLEARLGTQLAQRSTRRLSLTEAGGRYAEGATKLMEQRADLEDSMSTDHSEIHGRIVVHSTMGLGRAHIAPLLGEFARRNPGVQTELTISDRPFNIMGTGIDVAVRVGQSPDSRLKMRRLYTNTRIVCASPGYLARHGVPQTPEDLAQHNCLILKENDNDYALWRFGLGDDQRTVRVTGSLGSNDGDVVVNWCRTGHGLILRSSWHVTPMLASGELVQVLADFPRPPADIHAVYSAAAHQPQRIALLLEDLRTGLTERLDAANVDKT